jgi:hypothetical protein
VIGEDQRPGAGSAFATINRDEVDSARPTGHQARQVLPERRIADGGLDADGKACFAGDSLDEVEHLVGVPEGAVNGRADAVAVHRNAIRPRPKAGGAIIESVAAVPPASKRDDHAAPVDATSITVTIAVDSERGGILRSDGDHRYGAWVRRVIAPGGMPVCVAGLLVRDRTRLGLDVSLCRRLRAEEVLRNVGP